jgi:hypothetical protein
MEGLTVGRMVHFVASESDCIQINRRRKDALDVRLRVVNNTWPMGAQAHVGNSVEPGQHLAAVIVYVWNDSGLVNLKVLLDGNDDFWATSISFAESPSPHNWHWIEKA